MNNYGDEMLFRSTIKLLKEVGVEDLYLLFPKSGSRKIGGIMIQHIPRNSPLKILSAIKQSDIIIGGGGNIFQDETSNRSFLYYKWLVSTALFYKKPVYLLGHGIGKINSKKNYTRLRKILSNELCRGYFRDTISYRYAKTCSEKHERGTDLGYYFLQNRTVTKNSPSRIGVFLKHPWLNPEDFIEPFKDEGFNEIQFFAAFPEQDLGAAEQSSKRFGEYFETTVKVGEVNEITDQASTCSLIISERLHGSIIASYFGIPFLSSDTFKMRSYFSDMKGYQAYFKDKSISEIAYAFSKLKEIDFEQSNQAFMNRSKTRLKAMKKWLKVQLVEKRLK
ncbi:MAG: polysaccharide pyruvyl transferase family protein [Thermotogota bacterium]|nr:polysaccharide pyruvyl transferase family protein [Thermotogota bacterium]